MAIIGKAVFFRVGCPVCLDVEQRFVGAINPALYNVEIVDLEKQKERLAEATAAGVQSVPALLIQGAVYHINFGADILDLFGEEIDHGHDFIDVGAGI
ncbi:thioredoxin [Mesorhizobium sp. SB112]|uniref:thioredoxin n=1 Tax=Mesorhizobium sp. SB112 TaxID=3151853 RepID=UPI003264A5EF